MDVIDDGYSLKETMKTRKKSNGTREQAEKLKSRERRPGG